MSLLSHEARILARRNEHAVQIDRALLTTKLYPRVTSV